eukprot:scaffold2715_cov19-Tisochrysis_lutea.AAC.1
MPPFTSSLGDVKLSFLKGCVCLDACTATLHGSEASAHVADGCATMSDTQFHTFLGDEMDAMCYVP